MPGFAPASPWALRLPQKFLFLLFLSGLFTLCFGALFLLPHSSRFKRFFLAPRARQPGLEAVPEVPGLPLAGARESPPNPAPAAPAPGAEDPSSLASPRRRKGWPRRTQPTRPREEATVPRGGGGGRGEGPQEGSPPFSFDFHAFRSRLRHPVLGTRTRGSEEPQSLVQTQREKIKEVRTLLPPKREDPPGLPSPSRPVVTPGPWWALDSPGAPCTLLSPPKLPASAPPSDPYPWPVAAEPLDRHPHPPPAPTPTPRLRSFQPRPQPRWAPSCLWSCW